MGKRSATYCILFLNSDELISLPDEKYGESCRSLESGIEMLNQSLADLKASRSFFGLDRAGATVETEWFTYTITLTEVIIKTTIIGLHANRPVYASRQAMLSAARGIAGVVQNLGNLSHGWLDPRKHHQLIGVSDLNCYALGNFLIPSL